MAATVHYTNLHMKQLTVAIIPVAFFFLQSSFILIFIFNSPQQCKIHHVAVPAFRDTNTER